MAVAEITEELLEEPEIPEKGNRVTWEADPKWQGFGIRVASSGRVTFLVRYWNGKKERWKTLGTYPRLTFKQAKNEAAKILREAEIGKDPVHEEQVEERISTVRERLDRGDLPGAQRALEELRSLEPNHDEIPKLERSVSEAVEARDLTEHTVRAHAERWMDYLPEHVTRRGRKISPRTVEQYVGCMKRYILPEIGNKIVTEVTDSDVEQIHTKVTKRGPYAANRTVNILGVFYSWLDSPKGGKVVPKGFNPASNPPQNPEQERGEHADVRLSPDQEARLVRAIFQLRDGVKRKNRNGKTYTHSDPIGATAILTLLDSGRRKNEVLKMKWSRLDLDDGIANLGATKGRKAGDTCYLTPRVCDAIRALPRIVGNPWVFTGPGKNGRRQGLQSAWETVKDLAELQEISEDLDGFKLHDLRHHRISELLGAGIAPQLVIQQVGHTSYEQLQRYGHVKVQDVAAVLSKLQSVEPAEHAEVVEIGAQA